MSGKWRADFESALERFEYAVTTRVIMETIAQMLRKEIIDAKHPEKLPPDLLQAVADREHAEAELWRIFEMPGQAQGLTERERDPFWCPGCGEKFDARPLVEYRPGQVREGEVDFECPLCDEPIEVTVVVECRYLARKPS